MAEYQHQGDHVAVRFSGELTLESAVDLVDTVDMLVRAYFYPVVELVIASPGGTALALEHYLDAQRRWRTAGVRVRTRVVGRAESAGALMLSLGDERIAEPGARLFFHHFRAFPPGSLTASASAVLFAQLTRLDEQNLARLVDRALATGAAMVSTGVESSDFQALNLLTAPLPSGAKGRPRTLRGLGPAS